MTIILWSIIGPLEIIVQHQGCEDSLQFEGGKEATRAVEGFRQYGSL
jgi:hypothetical protein